MYNRRRYLLAASGLKEMHNPDGSVRVQTPARSGQIVLHLREQALPASRPTYEF